MPTRWISDYTTAMREHDPQKLETLYERAHHQINTRILELKKTKADAREKAKLEEALRQLTLHKFKTETQN